MKVFVTGATGFIGSHLCEALTARCADVHFLFRNDKKRKRFAVPGNGFHGELSTNIDSPNDWLDQIPPDIDAVVHAAGLTLTHRTNDFADTNTIATKRLVMDLAARHPNIHFLLLSSLAAVGPDTVPKTEDAPLQPVSTYGKSKAATEHFVRESAPSGWRVSILRPPIVFGPRDPVTLQMFKMVKGRLVFLPGRGKPFSFVAVQDLVEMMCRCIYKSADKLSLEEAQPIQTYFPCHPVPVLYEEIMRSMAKAQNIRRTATISLFPSVMWMVAGLGQLLFRMGFEKAVALTPDKVREAIQVGWVCSPQKTIDELGMKYEYDLDRAIQCATDDYRNRGWL